MVCERAKSIRGRIAMTRLVDCGGCDQSSMSPFFVHTHVRSGTSPQVATCPSPGRSRARHSRPMRNRLDSLSILLVLGLWLLVSGSSVGAAVASDRPAPEGVWPLVPSPTVVSGFDPPDTRWGAGHRGVDLAGSPGQVVRSALPGTITFASVLAGRSVVVVDHGATRTTYEPVVASVSVGDVVEAGHPIGRLELRQSHCLPAACLHWGLIRNPDDVYLDPLSLVGAQRVRLLPFDGLVAPSGDAFPPNELEPRPPSELGVWQAVTEGNLIRD